MKKICLHILTGLFALTSCQTEIDTKQEAAKLLQTDFDFAAMSAEKGAAEAFRFYLDENAIQLPSARGPVVGRDSVFLRMKNSPLKYELTWEPQTAEVSASCDMGYTWGKSVFSFKTDQGEIKKIFGKYLNVWRKQSDGSWKVLIDIGNENPGPEEEKRDTNE